MSTPTLLAVSIILGTAFAISAAEIKSTTAPYPQVGSVERHDPKFDQLIAADAKIEKLGEGFTWSEGPVWVKQGGYLLFSDVPENVVYKWKDGEGVSVYLKPSGFLGSNFPGKEPGSNGLTISPKGDLILCQHGERQVARMDAPLSEPQPRFVPLAKHYEGKKLNSPNDLCYDKAGNLYFTDPPYGLPKQNESDPWKELPFQGVYQFTAKGITRLLVKEMERPNGIALSPDNKTLYINNSHGPRPVMMAYDLNADAGAVKNGRVFYNAQPLVDRKLPGALDGMKVDQQGNIWTTGPGGVHVIDATGKLMGSIITSTNTGNCAWGDDGSTLYICANHELWRIRTKTKGAGW